MVLTVIPDTKFDIYIFILGMSYVHYFYWSAYRKPGK